MSIFHILNIIFNIFSQIPTSVTGLCLPLLFVCFWKSHLDVVGGLTKKYGFGCAVIPEMMFCGSFMLSFFFLSLSVGSLQDRSEPREQYDIRLGLCLIIYF